MENLTTALGLIGTFEVMIAISIGAFAGIIFGAIPGLTYSMALALMLPFTFTMEPVTGISLLLATYIGGMTGGSISAILIGIWAYRGGHKCILFLQFFYATAGIIGMIRWFG